MAIKEFFRKLNYEIKRRENAGMFALTEFYFPNDDTEVEPEVGETQVSITGKLRQES